MINFFELFQIKESPFINQEELRKKYFQLHKNNDNKVSMSLINEGYATLLNITSLILHILKINNISLNDNVNLSVLSEIIDFQENIRDPNKKEKIIAEIEDKLKILKNKAMETASKKEFFECSEIIQNILFLEKIIAEY